MAPREVEGCVKATKGPGNERKLRTIPGQVILTLRGCLGTKDMEEDPSERGQRQSFEETFSAVVPIPFCSVSFLFRFLSVPFSFVPSYFPSF